MMLEIKQSTLIEQLDDRRAAKFGEWWAEQKVSKELKDLVSKIVEKIGG